MLSTRISILDADIGSAPAAVHNGLPLLICPLKAFSSLRGFRLHSLYLLLPSGNFSFQVPYPNDIITAPKGGVS
jgi:hypothetical protein